MNALLVALALVVLASSAPAALAAPAPLRPLGPDPNDTFHEPEPAPSLEQRIASCRSIEWNSVTYPVVFCPTGVVWARWSNHYSYSGHWSAHGGVVAITWYSHNLDVDGSARVWEAMPILSAVRHRGQRIELVDTTGNVALIETKNDNRNSRK